MQSKVKKIENWKSENSNYACEAEMIALNVHFVSNLQPWPQKFVHICLLLLG